MPTSDAGPVSATDATSSATAAESAPETPGNVRALTGANAACRLGAGDRGGRVGFVVVADGTAVAYPSAAVGAGGAAMSSVVAGAAAARAPLEDDAGAIFSDAVGRGVVTTSVASPTPSIAASAAVDRDAVAADPGRFVRTGRFDGRGAFAVASGRSADVASDVGADDSWAADFSATGVATVAEVGASGLPVEPFALLGRFVDDRGGLVRPPVDAFVRAGRVVPAADT